LAPARFAATIAADGALVAGRPERCKGEPVS